MRLLITGASKGLGLVASNYFEAEGHTVHRWSSKQCNYLDFVSWDYKVPPIDAVIHCAGGGLGLKSPYLSAEALYQLFMVNLGGAVELNRFIAIRMREEGLKGRIIHVCSIASGEAVGSVGYNTVKAALGAYVRSFGREMAPHGIVVSGIAPGGFYAPGNAMERLAANNPPAYQEFVDKRLPRGYMGGAEELIPILKYLVSEDASMMGGCVVPIDAGEGHYY